MAQRGGGGHGGGGFGGGGFHGGGMGGGFGGGGFRGGGGFGGGGFRGGFGNGGFRGGFGFNRFGFGNPGWGWGGGWGLGWGVPWGVGWGYDTCWDYNSCYPYGGYGYDPGYGYGSGYVAPAYSTSPNVTVISVPPTGPAYTSHASPVTREYDQYGQEVQPSGGTAQGASPVYLIAFNDHNIRAAQAYWVDGQVLHYVTLQHEEKQVALNEVDRKLSSQLNSERHVAFQLP